MKRPNVILIIVDTARADHISCYGYDRKTTPNIDDVAKQGVLFRNAFSTSPWTPPAHASIFTGKYPSHHGTFGRNVQFQQGNPSLPQILSSHGYRCIGVTTSPLLGLESGFGKGFDEYIDISAEDFFSNLGLTRLRVADLIRTSIYGPDKGSHRATQLTKSLLKKYSKNNLPFFLFINYLDCHIPYDPPRPFKERFCSDFSEPLLYGKEWFLKRMLGRTSEVVNRKSLDIHKLRLMASGRGGAAFSVGKLKVSDEEWEIIKSWYDGEIAYVDSLIGNLVDFLRYSDLFDDTLMIITSDHGESFGEHGLAGHAICVYDSVLHVPLIITLPPLVEEKKEIRELVSTIDIFPTVLDAAAIDFEEQISGESLFPFDERKIHDFICAEYAGLHFRHAFKMRKQWEEFNRIDRGCRCIRDKTHKYILTKGEVSDREELYDTLHDPFEQTNIIGEYPAVAKSLKQKLQNVFDLSYFGPEEIPSNQKMMEKLKALGYI